MKRNKLLEKQLIKFLPAELHESEELQSFIQAVGYSYDAFERDNELSARAFRISEEEYEDINKKLKLEVKVKKISILKLKEAIKDLDDSTSFLDDENDDLPEIIEYLKQQIANRKQAEEDLIIAREIAEESSRAKETFLVNMSHEIRTPMNAILGMSNQLAKTVLNNKQHFYLDVIQSASENLLIILNDILDISKIEAGKLYLENIGFEPRKLINRSLQVFMHRAEEKGLTISNSYTDSMLSSVLIGDPHRLNQVLLNLISNAIKFTEKGTIDLSCILIDNNTTHQTIEFRVKDTGVGMDVSFLKNVFQKFLQEDKSTARKYGGTGLGMAICKQLIELMNGSIRVDSEKHIGTTISFRVTLAKGSAADLPQIIENNIDLSILKNKRILLVDDNEMNRLVASTILKYNHIRYEEAHNGAEAVTKTLNQKFDLVLMDIQMPILDGLDATRQIRQKLEQPIPIIALTANALKGEEEKCKSAGMDAYLSKPFKEKELLSIMSKLISTSEKAKMENKNHDSDFMQVKQNFDLQFLYQVFGSNPASIPPLLMAFTNEAQKSLSQIENCISSNNTEGLKDSTHRIKSNLAMLNAHDMRILAHKIETTSEGKCFTDELKSDTINFKEGLRFIVSELQKENFKHVS